MAEHDSQGETTIWGAALAAALEANRPYEGRPDNWYALAAALAATEGSTQKSQSWKRTIARIRKDGTVTEKTALLLARALQVDRMGLPESSGRPTLAEHQRRLAELEARLERLGARLDPPDAAQER